MIKWLLILSISIHSLDDISRIAKINSLKKEAEEAYAKGNYEKAISSYTFLLDSMQVDDEEATINLGHAFYKTGDKEAAQSRYQKLALSKNQKLKSIAYQQLGALSNDPQTLQNALSYFKASIKADPTNENARYNYELVKKKLDNQQNQDQNQDQQNEDQQNEDQNNDQENQQQENEQNQEDQQNQSEDQQNEQSQDEQNQQSQEQDQEQQENQDQQQQQQDENGEESEEQQQNQSQEDQEGEQNDQEQQQSGEPDENNEQNEEQQATPSTAEKLEEMNLTEEKARMILEALKNSEVQYIQQNRRKPTKRQDSGKPDW